MSLVPRRWQTRQRSTGTAPTLAGPDWDIAPVRELWP